MVHDNLVHNGMSQSMPEHVLGWYIIFVPGKVYLAHSDCKLSDNLGGSDDRDR
jgi:hypothetical protein